MASFVNQSLLPLISGEKNKFTLVYMLHNYQLKHSIGIQVDIDRQQAEMESMHTLWGQVETYERELNEMFGINFIGSPRLGENFCLEGWDEIPPMRKEFDLVKYSKNTFFEREGRYTVDVREYMQQQGYADHIDNRPPEGKEE